MEEIFEDCLWEGKKDFFLIIWRLFIGKKYGIEDWVVCELIEDIEKWGFG